MKITLPTGGTADLSHNSRGGIQYSFDFNGRPLSCPRIAAALKWLDEEGFADQQRGDFEPDSHVTELIQSL